MTYQFTIMVCIASWFEMPATESKRPNSPSNNQINIAYFYNLNIEAENSMAAIESARRPVEDIIASGTLIDAYCPIDQSMPIEEILNKGKHLYTRISYVDYVDSAGNHFADPQPNLMPRTGLNT